jgi:hypothetical protein
LTISPLGARASNVPFIEDNALQATEITAVISRRQTTVLRSEQRHWPRRC